MFSQADTNVLRGLQGKALKSVFLKAYSANKVGRQLRFDTVALVFDLGWIEITVDENTDQLLLQFGNSTYPNQQNDVLPGIFNDLIGETLGWIWVAKNDRGYHDMVAISFSGPIPELAFCGIASDIAVLQMDELLA